MKKYNQNAFGDYFVSKRYPDESRLVAVLSDGLGSGIKANILSCMTATMLSKFISNDQIPIRQASEIIMNSLPVCKVRHISYSTFSAIDCFDDGNAKIVEEGNPDFVWIRDGEVIEPPFETSKSKTCKNRKLKIYKVKFQLGDRVIFCSDGVTQAGLGGGKLKLGLRRDGLISILKDKLAENPEISSSELSSYIVNQARNIETDRNPKDDYTKKYIEQLKIEEEMKKKKQTDYDYNQRKLMEEYEKFNQKKEEIREKMEKNLDVLRMKIKKKDQMTDERIQLHLEKKQKHLEEEKLKKQEKKNKIKNNLE